MIFIWSFFEGAVKVNILQFEFFDIYRQVYRNILSQIGYIIVVNG